MQVNASLQNQNLRTNLRWVAKCIHKTQKAINFTHIQLTCNQLLSTCVGWPDGEKLASTCVRSRAWPKSTQVGGQTKRRLMKTWNGPLDIMQLIEDRLTSHVNGFSRELVPGPHPQSNHKLFYKLGVLKSQFLGAHGFLSFPLSRRG